MPEENIVGIVSGTSECGAGPRNGCSQNAHSGKPENKPDQIQSRRLRSVDPSLFRL